jgi:hypothetical protein
MSRKYQDEVSDTPVTDQAQASVATEAPAAPAAEAPAKKEALPLPDPSLIGASAEDLAKRSAQKQLRSGFCFLLHPTFEEVTVSSNKGSILVNLTMAPCNEKFKACRPLVSHMIVLPFANPSIQGHVGPDTWKMCSEYLSAEDENFEGYPHRVKGSKPAQYLCSDGHLCNAEENRIIRARVEAAVNERLKERYGQYVKTGRSDFTKKTAFVYGLVESVTQADGEYAGKASLKVTRFSAKPIDGVQLLVDPDQFGEEVKKNA